MWGSFYSSFAGTLASSGCMQAAALAAQRQRRQQFDTYRDQLTVLAYAEPKRAPQKCESCGSREFRDHHGQTVCAYCRGGA